MKLSEQAAAIFIFIEEHGDLEIETEYWCEDCQDYHTSDGFDIAKLPNGNVNLSIKRLGEK